MFGLPHGLDPDLLRSFVLIAESGSFTRAARVLGTDQSTVSRRLAALEVEIGAPLFERTPRGPVPTEIGARLREDAERVEAEMRRFSDTATLGDARPRGVVRLATTESMAIHFLVPRVLPTLARSHPEIDIELLTIKVRLMVASVERAQEMGINWWESDPFVSTGSDEDRGNGHHEQLERRLAALEQRVAGRTTQNGTDARPGEGQPAEAQSAEAQSAGAQHAGAQTDEHA